MKIATLLELMERGDPQMPISTITIRLDSDHSLTNVIEQWLQAQVKIGLRLTLDDESNTDGRAALICDHLLSILYQELQRARKRVISSYAETNQ